MLLTALSDDEIIQLESDIRKAVKNATDNEIDADSVVLTQLQADETDGDADAHGTDNSNRNSDSANTGSTPGITATLELALEFAQNNSAVNLAKGKLDAQIKLKTVKISVQGKDVVVEQSSVIKVFAVVPTTSEGEESDGDASDDFQESSADASGKGGPIAGGVVAVLLVLIASFGLVLRRRNIARLHKYGNQTKKERVRAAAMDHALVAPVIQYQPCQNNCGYKGSKAALLIHEPKCKIFIINQFNSRFYQNEYSTCFQHVSSNTNF